MLLQGVGISRVEVGVGRRSYFVIRVVVLIFSSRIKLATELYSVLLGMFTSRSTLANLFNMSSLTCRELFCPPEDSF